MSERPVILITNDDGVNARGLRALRAAVLALGRVIVVAPTREQSASSHSITFDRPLRHIQHDVDLHSIDGTPADCIYLALFEQRFLPRKPDLVLSGINHGHNLGTSVFYSGTIAGAREAALRGIPAIAFSAPPDSDVERDAAHAALLAQRFLSASRSAGGEVALLNVNFPKGDPRGRLVTRVGRQLYEESVIPRRDPGGREYFWIGGRLIDCGERDGTDAHAVEQGYVSITPLALEATHHAQLELAERMAGD